MAVKSLIETVTVGAGGAASIEFTAIPQDGVDLVLLLSLRTSASNTYRALNFDFNGVFTGYSSLVLQGDGSNATSFTNFDFWGRVPGGNATADTFANNSVFIANYASSNSKSWSVDSVTENNSSSAVASLVAGLWDNTSAITSISMNAAGQDLAQYSTASLYKIKYD
jgi:hypothetical protein